MPGPRHATAQRRDPARPSTLAGAAIALTLVATIGCATPAERAARSASELGFERDVEQGDPFEHVLYRRGRPTGSRPLHVYLEGDGSPVRAARYRPPDPTPSNPVMLRLMALDPAPSLYLGRPGQHGARCDPWYFTQGRYAADVVESLAIVLEQAEAPGGLVLLGHSGGGALAMLLAERVAGVRAVVTLAGNLDTAAWTRHHGDATLGGSLNPADRPPLPAGIVQIHAIGAADDEVPRQLVEPVLAREPSARILVFAGLEHACCWESVWPAILDELAASE